jgi:hypothetical protein
MSRCLLTLTVALLPTIAFAQSGVQWTRERDATMISKDIGGERWAITYRVSDGRVTGNVLKADGSPAFVQCNRLSTTSSDEAFECFGAGACDGAPCSSAEYVSLGTVLLGRSFFFPPGDGPGNPQPTPRPTPGLGVLQSLLGRWRFTYTILETYEETYNLQRTRPTVPGFQIIEGVDAFGDRIIVARYKDIITGFDAGYSYALVDYDDNGCDLYGFEIVGPDRLEGEQFIVLGDDCENVLTIPSDFVGERLSGASSLTEGCARDEKLSVAEPSDVIRLDVPLRHLLEEPRLGGK